MKIVLERVSSASVSVGDKVTGSIGNGFLVLLGVGASDDKTTVERAVEKIRKLRVFADSTGKSNLSISDVGGELLVVSQFTLYADCSKGNRPSFTDAAEPSLAEELYEHFILYSGDKFKSVQSGVFGASMQVALVNSGPYTIILEV